MVLLFMCGCLTARVLIVLVLYWRLPLVDDRKKILYQMRTPFRAEQIEESNQKKNTEPKRTSCSFMSEHAGPRVRS